MNPHTTSRTIAIVGSTGSIGTQALDIVDRYPGLYRVAVLSAGTRVEALIEQALKYRPEVAVIADPRALTTLREGLRGSGVKAMSGEQALCDAVSRSEIDIVLTATVGYSGLAPTIAAIRAGKDIALANKETLVVAGELIRSLLANSKSQIFPVDSEHSAIAQCLRGENPATVKSLIVTASGGPFRTWTKEQLRKATVREALNHPNWSMGPKITVDSATMMNKAFELIEARWLFNIAPQKIRAIVHPQSVIHSMVEFTDGAIKAQLGVPDMRLPIAYALGMNTRLPRVSEPLDITTLNGLTFEEPDTDRFPCLTLAKTAMTRGGNTACVINAANEIANSAFRTGIIPLPAIYQTIIHTLEHATFVAEPTYGDYVDSNAEAREIATEALAKFKHA